MRIANVEFRGADVSLLVQYGWGDGYAQASRLWNCRDIVDATRQDISEPHEAWSTLDPSTARLAAHLQDGGTLRVSDMQAAFEPSSAQQFLRTVAATLGINPVDVAVTRIGKTMDLSSATERLVAAAKKSLHAALVS